MLWVRKGFRNGCRRTLELVQAVSHDAKMDMQRRKTVGPIQLLFTGVRASKLQNSGSILPVKNVACESDVNV